LQFITFGRRPSTAHWRRCQIGAAADRRAQHCERSHVKKKQKQNELCKKKKRANMRTNWREKQPGETSKQTELRMFRANGMPRIPTWAAKSRIEIPGHVSTVV